LAASFWLLAGRWRLVAVFLPSVMRESLIGLCHPVNVFFFLDGCTFSIGSIQQLVTQLVDHASFRSAASIGQQPTDRQRGTSVSVHFHRHLIVRATHTASLYFKQRLGILDGFREELQRFVTAAFFLHLGEGFIENPLGGRALALPHHRVDELRHQIRAINRIGWHGPFCCMSFTRHSVSTRLTLLRALGAIF